MKQSVVFFGSGPVAAKSLELLTENFDISAVITKPATLETMSKIVSTPVFAVSNKVELDQLISVEHFNSQLAVLVDFGIIVSQVVIGHFPLGIVNSHFSILPQWRGADPITSAILSGQSRTGVSLMLLVEKMDEGPLLAQEIIDIDTQDTAINLTDNLIELSHKMLSEILPQYAANQLKPYPQASSGTSYSRKLIKTDGILDFNKPAEELEREVRAFIDWPKSRTTLAGKDVILTKTHIKPTSRESTSPGKVAVGEDSGELLVECGKDSLNIDRLKPAGKKEMTADEFVRGYGQALERRGS